MSYYEIRCPRCGGTVYIDFKANEMEISDYYGTIYLKEPKAWCTNCSRRYAISHRHL